MLGEGLRERKKRATRRAIGEAAMRLAVERGIDNVRIQDVAAEANVSVRTFSNYYANLPDAICGLGLDRAESIADAFRARPSHEPMWSSIKIVVVHEYESQGEAPDPEWAARLRLVLTSPALRGSYLTVTAATEAALARAIADRWGVELANDLRPEILAGSIVAATHVALRRWSEADPPVALRPLVERALDELATAWPLDEAAP